jgi:hypothetical protein
MSLLSNIFPETASSEDIFNADPFSKQASPEEIEAALAAERGEPTPTPAPTPTPTPAPTPVPVAQPEPTLSPVPVGEDQAESFPLNLSVGPNTDKESEEKSIGGAVTAAASAAADTTLPTVAALAAFPKGAAIAGAAFSPTGPGAVVAGVVGGLAASMAAYWATDAAKDAAFNYVSPESFSQFQAHLEKSKEDYPVSTFVGQTVVPMRVAMKASVSGLTEAVSYGRQLLTGSADLASTVGKKQMENFMNVVFGAGTELGGEALRQFQEEGRIDFALLGAATLVGAGMNKPTKFGQKLLGLNPFDSKLPSDPIVNQSDEELAQSLLDRLQSDQQGGNQPSSQELFDATREGGTSRPADEVPAAEPVSPPPPPKERTASQIKQDEEDAAAVNSFSKLITGKLLDDPKVEASAAEVMNLDALNAAITREPEQAIKAIAIALKESLKEAKGSPLTFDRRFQEAKQWMKEHGYQERVALLTKNAESVSDLNHQIIAARFMAERAIKNLEAAELKWRNSNEEIDLANAVVAMQDLKKVLFPLEQARTNWGRLGHAFRGLGPDKQNLATVRSMMKMANIDDLSELSGERAEQFMVQLGLALRSENPKAVQKALNMTTGQLISGALGEAITGAVMSPAHTTLINVVGGAGETLMTPISGTVGSLARLAMEVIKSPLKATPAMLQRAYEIEGSVKYLAYVGMRAKANLAVAFDIIKNSEPRFGVKSSQLVEIRGGMPVDRSQRVADETKGVGAAVARSIYKKTGKIRTQGFISSETFGINPNTNPLGAVTADVLGETFRVVHRGILAADELVKASNAYAAARSKFLVEGRMKGLKGDDLQKYIDERSNILLDANNNLYTRERVQQEVLAELKSEGVTGSELYPEMVKRTNERFDEGMGAMAEEAEAWARQITYQTDLGDYTTGTQSLGKRFQKLMTSIPSARIALGFYFIQSPVNMVKMTGRYIPNAALIELIGRVKVGDRTLKKRFPILENIQREHTEAMLGKDEFRKNQAVGRQLMGIFFASAGYQIAASGYTTGGGPQSTEGRKAWMSENVPYSFKIPKESKVGRFLSASMETVGVKPDKETGGHYFFEYKRIFEPGASFLMASSDLVDYMKRPEADERDIKEASAAFALIVGRQLSEKVYFNNIKQMVDLVTKLTEDGGTAGQKILTYLGRRVAPLGMPILENRDPLQLELTSFVQHIARRQPAWLRGKTFGEDYFLPRAYNLLGENIDAPISNIPVVDFFNPFWIGSKPNDPLLTELNSLFYDWSAPEKYRVNVEGKMLDIRFLNYKNDNDIATINASSEEPTKFSYEKVVESLKGVPVNKRTTQLVEEYNKYGVTSLPETNQDAYDRWQQNTGQIKLGGKTLRERLEMLITLPQYTNLEKRVFKGEQNPRAALVVGVISEYRQAALGLTRLEYPELNMMLASKKVTNELLRLGGKREDISTGLKKVKDLITFPNENPVDKPNNK